MLPAQRRDRILSEVHKDRFISVLELAQRLSVSISTVRRDLVDLEREGVIVRTHGGAALVGRGLPEEMSEKVRAQQRIEQKRAIARAAAPVIEGSGTAILDSGTTTLEVARCLNPREHLRIVTDSVEIAWELRDRENITVILTGGVMRKNAYNLFGTLAEQSLMGLHAQVCVMGCSGLTLEEGLTKHDIEALPVRRRMIEVSRQLIVVADSSKLGRTGLASICEIERVDTLITDPEISPEFKRGLEGHGVEVIIAE